MHGACTLWYSVSVSNTLKAKYTGKLTFNLNKIVNLVYNRVE